MDKRIAVPVDENGILEGHFGHCKFFAFLDIEGNNIVKEELLPPPRHEPGVLPKWIAENGATDVLAGGMGNSAIQIFNRNNVNVFVGAPQVSAKEVTLGFLNKTIEFKSNYCDH